MKKIQQTKTTQKNLNWPTTWNNKKEIKQCETSWNNLRQPNLRRTSKTKIISQLQTTESCEKQPRTNENHRKNHNNLNQGSQLGTTKHERKQPNNLNNSKQLETAWTNQRTSERNTKQPKTTNTSQGCQNHHPHLQHGIQAGGVVINGILTLTGMNGETING